MAQRIWKGLLIAGVAVFLGSILVSMWHDLLAPQLAEGDTAGFVRHLGAMALAFAGLAGVVVGGWLIVHGIVGYTPAAEEEGARAADMRAQRPSVWRGLALMLAGFVCFVLMNRLIDR